MDASQVIALLTGSPLALVLLYLLVREQKAHDDTRASAAKDNRDWMERFVSLADRNITALDNLRSAIDKLGDRLPGDGVPRLPVDINARLP